MNISPHPSSRRSAPRSRFSRPLPEVAATRRSKTAVRVAGCDRDVRSIQNLRYRLLGSFAGAIAGFTEVRDGLVEPADLSGVHLAAFDHRSAALMAVRLDEISGQDSSLPPSVVREIAAAGVDLADGAARSLSDRLHIAPGAGGHLMIRMIAKMMEQARRRGWVGDLCRCDPEHFEIRRELGYRSLGVFAPSADGRYPTQELMYLDLPRTG